MNSAFRDAWLVLFLAAWLVPIAALLHGTWRRAALRREAKRLGLHVQLLGRTLALRGRWHDFEVELSETSYGEGKQTRAFHVVMRVRPATGATPPATQPPHHAQHALPLGRSEDGWLEGSRGERLHHTELSQLLDTLVYSAREPLRREPG